MEFSYRSLGAGLLIAVVVIAFTFATALAAAAVRDYNLAVSVAFVMGGLFSVCLYVILKKIPFSG